MTARSIRRTIRGVTLAFTVLVTLALVAPAAGADTTKVSVNDNFFKPRRVTVAVGDRVTWKWDGFVSHNVTVERGPQKFKSQTQSEGKFSRVIRKPGVYRIVCTLHPGMTMRLRATPEPEPKAKPTSTSTSVPPST